MKSVLLWFPLCVLHVVPPAIGQTVECDALTADLNQDNRVDFDDFFLFADQFGLQCEIATGQVLSLDGDGDWVDVAQLQRTLTSASMEVWIKTSTTSQGVIVSIEGGHLFYINRHSASGDLLPVFDGSSVNDVQITSDDFSDGQWHHLVGTNDGTMTRLYADGNLISEREESLFDLSESDNEVRIGANVVLSGADFAPFDGLIDEVRLWDRALTNQQILANANIKLSGSEEGLIGYWNFDLLNEDGTVSDLSGNGNHGTLVGNAQVVESDVSCEQLTADLNGDDAVNYGDFFVLADQFGLQCEIEVGGQALSLDGDGDYLNILGSESIEPDHITVEGWVWVTDTNPLPQFMRKEEHNGSGYDFRWDEGGVIRFWIKASGAWNAASVSASEIPDQSWHHIAGTYDGSTINMYVDGVLSGSRVHVGGNIDHDDSDLHIGSSIADVVGRELSGLVDEVRLWNRALTTEEIQANMNSTLTGNESGLVGYWDFDGLDDDGLVPDLSGNENHGTLVGDANLVTSDAPIE